MDEIAATDHPQDLVVLVVDDDRAVRDVIDLALSAEGMTVVGANDGSEALSVLRREHVDVVLLEIVLPRVDGWMTLMEIRNDPALTWTPVIIVSSKTEDLAKIHAFRQGAQQYVTKPFNVEELSARVRAAARREHAPAVTARTRGEPELHKLAVRKGGRTVLLDVDDIVYVSARNKSTYVHTYENQYILDHTLSELEERLTSESFTRVHRSYMVNLQMVKEIVRAESGYSVIVADRDETIVPVARRQARAFRGAVGI